MNVLVVSEPGVDGVFRYVDGLCRYLADNGAQVHLAYSDRRSCPGLPDLVGFVAGRGGATLNLRTSNRPAPADLRAFVSLARLARRIRPGVIHSHSSKAGALARALPMAGVRSVQVYHPHAYIGMRPSPGRLDFLYDRIEAVLGRTAYTINCSSAERAYAVERLRLPLARLYAIQNGVDTAVFRPPAADEKARLRAAFGLPAGRPVLGFMGRSSAQKDPQTLYRALARAAFAHPEIALFHVGSGELDPELERLAAELRIGNRLFRRPYLAPSADFFRAVDGVILTSRYEGLSLVALEALASGLPLILSEVRGNTDLLAEPLSHAWRAGEGDVWGFANAIGAWLGSLKAGLPSNHRRIACRKFNHAQSYATVLALYRRWVEARRTGLPGRPRVRFS